MSLIFKTVFAYFYEIFGIYSGFKWENTDEITMLMYNKCHSACLAAILHDNMHYFLPGHAETIAEKVACEIYGKTSKEDFYVLTKRLAINTTRYLMLYLTAENDDHHGNLIPFSIDSEGIENAYSYGVFVRLLLEDLTLDAMLAGGKKEIDGFVCTRKRLDDMSLFERLIPAIDKTVEILSEALIGATKLDI